MFVKENQLGDYALYMQVTSVTFILLLFVCETKLVHQHWQYD